MAATFQAAPILTAVDNAVGGARPGKQFNTHNSTFALVSLKMQGAPAPFSVQTPPRTQGRPF